MGTRWLELSIFVLTMNVKHELVYQNLLDPSTSKVQECVKVDENLYVKEEIAEGISDYAACSGMDIKQKEVDIKDKLPSTCDPNKSLVEKPFARKVCKYQTEDENNVVQHKIARTNQCHPSPHIRSALKTVQYSSVGEYEASSNLVQHMKTRTGEKPSSCSISECKTCKSNYFDYKWSQMGVRHIKSHTEEKLNCNKIVQIQRDAAGKKNYSHPLCDYKTSTRKRLLQHMERHTREEPKLEVDLKKRSTGTDKTTSNLKLRI